MSATSTLKDQIQADMKSAMRSGEKERLGTIRLILAAIKQVEVDSRKELSDSDLVAILDKMGKQRRESIEQFEQASRQDLADKEKAELAIINGYLPAQLSETEVLKRVQQAIQQANASTMKDMGAVMGILKPQLQGQADMAQVSQLVKSKLTS